MWKPPAMEQVVALQAGWTPWSLQQERMTKRAPQTLQPKAEDGWNGSFNPPVKTDNGWRSSPEPPVGTEAESAATESSGRHEVEPAGAEYSGRDKTEPADTESSGRDEADGWNGSPEPPVETRNGWSGSSELPAQKKNGWSSSSDPQLMRHSVVWEPQSAGIAHLSHQQEQMQARKCEDPWLRRSRGYQLR